MAINTFTGATANNDWLNKPLKDIYQTGAMGTASVATPTPNVGVTTGVTTPKTNISSDLAAFNQQQVKPTTTTNTNTTQNTTNGNLSSYYDPNVGIYSDLMAYSKEKANTAVPTEEEARQQALKNMQAEIDATNALYADKLRRAQTQGTGLIGQTGAIQARRGLLGSDFGTAQTEGVKNANEEVYGSIENERLVKINQIQTKAREDATAAIAEKRAAKEAGLKDYVDYLSKEKTLKDTALNNTISDMIANNIDIKDFNQSEIDNLAKSYGVTGAKLKSAYNQAKTTQTAETNKLAAQQAKDSRVSIGEGQRIFQIDPVTGEYKEVAYNPKTYAPKAGLGSGGSFGTAYTGSNSAGSIIDKVKQLDPVIAGYADQLLNKQTTLSSIPEQYRDQVALATKTVGDAKGINVANQILKKLDEGIEALSKKDKSGMLSGSIAGKSFFGISPARINQDVENFRVVLDTLRAAQTINAIPLMKGTGPLSNADMRILENSQSELSPTLDEATLLEKMTQLRNELEPARLGNSPYGTMQPQGGYNAAPENQEEQYNIGDEVEVNGVTYRIIDETGNMEQI